MTHPSDEHVRAVQQIAHNTRGSILNRSLLVALLLVTIDVLLVAHLQQPAALAILQYTPPITLFTGVLVNLLAVALVPGVFALATITAVSALRRRFTTAGNAFAGAVLLYAGGTILLDRNLVPDPFWIGICASLFAILTLIAHVLIRAHSWPIDPHLISVIVALIGISAVALMLSKDEVRIAIARPYLPAEQLKIHGNDDSRPTTLTGYVLNSSDDGGWTTVLREDTRSVLLIRTRDLEERIVCRPDGVSTGTPWWQLVDVPAAETDPPCG